MARPRKKGSPVPYGNIGLDSDEEEKLKRILKKKDISIAKVRRYLFREWIKQQTDPTSGVLKLDKL